MYFFVQKQCRAIIIIMVCSLCVYSYFDRTCWTAFHMPSLILASISLRTRVFSNLTERPSTSNWFIHIKHSCEAIRNGIISDSNMTCEDHNLPCSHFNLTPTRRSSYQVITLSKPRAVSFLSEVPSKEVFYM